MGRRPETKKNSASYFVFKRSVNPARVMINSECGTGFMHLNFKCMQLAQDCTCIEALNLSYLLLTSGCELQIRYVMINFIVETSDKNHSFE